MKDRFEATQLVLTAVFLGAGLIVTVHLWSGYMVLPDFATGPANHLPSAFWGLGQDGRTDGIVPQMVAFVGRGLLGSHLFGWLARCAFFPIAGLGAARVVG